MLQTTTYIEIISWNLHYWHNWIWTIQRK